MTWRRPKEVGRKVCCVAADARCHLVFAVYFTVLDAIGGIGLDARSSCRSLKAATKKQTRRVKLLLNKMWIDPPLVGGSG